LRRTISFWKLDCSFNITNYRNIYFYYKNIFFR